MAVVGCYVCTFLSSRWIDHEQLRGPGSRRLQNFQEQISSRSLFPPSSWSMGGAQFWRRKKNESVCQVALRTGKSHERKETKYSRYPFRSVKCKALPSEESPKPRKKEFPKLDEMFPELDEKELDELQSYLDLELETDMGVDTKKHYEVMFIIHEKDYSEVQAVIDQVKEFVGKNKGTIYRLNDWGLRRLAYKIKKAEKGNYVLMNIEVSSSVINDLNSMFEKDERVIRHMVITQKKAITEDLEPPEEWRPSSAYAEGEDYDEEEEEDDEEEEEEDEDDDIEAGRISIGELILDRQK